MEKYLEQLIEDMRIAATRVPPPGPIWDEVDMDNIDELLDIAYIEENFIGIPEPVEDIVGIKRMMLPPLDKITPEQAGRLYPEMEKLLNAYHFELVFPEGMPTHEKYRTLCEIWDSEQVLVGAGHVEIDFCESAWGCPFPVEFCECQIAEEQMKWDEEQARKQGDDPDDWNDDFDIRDLWPI